MHTCYIVFDVIISCMNVCTPSWLQSSLSLSDLNLRACTCGACVGGIFEERISLGFRAMCVVCVCVCVYVCAPCVYVTIVRVWPVFH